jgi:purine-binding chemotaxis protein CheW
MNPLVASPPGAPVADAPAQHLIFQLAGEPFAIEIFHIREIIEFGQLTEVPMMPAFIRGVINLRGAVVPVIDLAARFGGAPAEVVRRTCIVIVEVKGHEGPQCVGVMVDAVSEVIDIARDAIEPPPAFGAHIRTDFIVGMGRVDGRFVVILDVGRVLSLDEMAALAVVAAQRDEAFAAAC